MPYRRLPLPPPRTLPWRLKPPESATTSLHLDRFGRMVMHIEHDLLKGVTPRMVAWWFGHIGGDMVVDGVTLNRYLVWHPFDHVRWELVRASADGRAGVGARFRIVEAFGRNPDHYVDVVDTVTRLDEGGITLVGYRLGLQLTHLNHDFFQVGGNTRYVSTLTVGTDLPGVRSLLNPLLHRTLFTDAMGRAWIKHNIEEVGLLEHMIPLIYKGGAAARGEPI